MAFARVALGPVDELARRKRTVVRVGGIELLVIFHRRRFTVVENRCPHAGAALDDARISGRTLTCSAHFHRYPLGGGSCVGRPRHQVGRGGRLRPLPTRDVDGCLYADIDAAQRTGQEPA
jgi:nitrite reductase/ring-hydroxylating ferredoxin subunit